MKEELQDKLFNRYKTLFTNVSKFQFGFECDDGWYDLICELFDGFVEILNDEKISIIQVKEKFGTLRVYLEDDDVTEKYYPQLENKIVEAELKSSKTCEICGNEGLIRFINSWAKTLCEEHYKGKKDGL